MTTDTETPIQRAAKVMKADLGRQLAVWCANGQGPLSFDLETLARAALTAALKVVITENAGG